MLAVVRDAIDPRALENTLCDPRFGGVVTFLGVVRERSDDGRAVDGLEYEAYEEMAVAQFKAIAHEVRTRFGDVQVAIVHRIGALRIGDIAVAVCAASPHRAAAFDACEYAIDAVKSRAAIWKKERYADGSQRWRTNCPT